VAFTWVRGYVAETNYATGDGHIFASATDGWTLERVRFTIRFWGRTTPASSWTDQPWRGQGLNFGIVEEYGGGITTDYEYVYTSRNSTDWLWWETVQLHDDSVSIYSLPSSDVFHHSTFSGPDDGVRDIKAKRKLGGTTPHLALHWGVHNTGVGPITVAMTMGYSALYSH